MFMQMKRRRTSDAEQRRIKLEKERYEAWIRTLSPQELKEETDRIQAEVRRSVRTLWIVTGVFLLVIVAIATFGFYSGRP